MGLRNKPMSSRKSGFARILWAALAGTGALFISLGSACEWTTKRFDPCGTLFANCNPGDFDLAFASVPDYLVDPTCTIPGACDPPGAFRSPYEQLGPGFEGP